MTASTTTGVVTTRRRLRWGRRGPAGTVGLGLLVLLVAATIAGPFVAPHPLDMPVGVPGSEPTSDILLGTDFLGRDVLSRVLHGGFPVLVQAAVSVAATCLIGVSVGMLAGISRSWVDPLLMRCVDVVMVFPPMLLLLVLIAGVGTSTWALILGVTLVLFPGLARIVRSATLEVSGMGFVEAAWCRGETIPSILRREVLPHVLPVVVADAGVRFLWSTFLVASMNFLGLGAQPPAANWGLMIAENRQVVSLNPWALAAPALLLALLSIAVNLVGDAFLRSRGRSGMVDR